mmetsp:Transcript_31096/g.105474  ORF Transcript_31096/g.105474 Transcript_31096/m.105474 type:complete len:103 (-) Transcript_31096:51-359(-)
MCCGNCSLKSSMTFLRNSVTAFRLDDPPGKKKMVGDPEVICSNLNVPQHLFFGSTSNRTSLLELHHHISRGFVITCEETMNMSCIDCVQHFVCDEALHHLSY